MIRALQFRPGTGPGEDFSIRKQVPTHPIPAALVTGAGIRVGRAIALALAKRGFNLVLHCKTSRRATERLAAEIRAEGGQAAVLQADLGRGSEAMKLARAALKVFGELDVLVNSAAVFWPTPLQRLNEMEIDAFLSVNLKGPYILSCEIGRRMKARGKGAIINLACVSGFHPWKNFVPYSISKAGVIALTQGLAKLLAPEVRVNAIAPGTVLPPKHMTTRQVGGIAARLPLKRIGTPEDIADAVLYMVGARFVTGQILCVDGGRSIV